jgi:hypothetical protein
MKSENAKRAAGLEDGKSLIDIKNGPNSPIQHFD